MTAAEADAMLARETGWTMDYVRSLNEYDKRLLFGWKPAKPPEQQDADIRRKIAMLTRRQGRGR